MTQMRIRQEVLKCIAGAAAAGFGAEGAEAAIRKEQPPNLSEIFPEMKDSSAQLIKAIEKWEVIQSQPKSLANLGDELSLDTKIVDLATKIGDLARPFKRRTPR